jgi:hypothetical protein
MRLKLLDDDKAILDALDDDFHGLIPSVSRKLFFPLLWTLHSCVTCSSHFLKAVSVGI